MRRFDSGIPHMIYLYAFGGVILVSLVSLVGIFSLSLREEWIRKYIFIFVSLAVGALLGDAFIHLIPEAFEESASSVGLFIIVGILIFFILEKFMHWHHHGEDEGEAHIHPVGKLVLLSDGVHNFIDGTIIALILGEAGGAFASWILPMAAGGFIYIAIADLIPELHKTKEIKYSALQLLAAAAGVLTILALPFF